MYAVTCMSVHSCSRPVILQQHNTKSGIYRSKALLMRCQRRMASWQEVYGNSNILYNCSEQKMISECRTCGTSRRVSYKIRKPHWVPLLLAKTEKLGYSGYTLTETGRMEKHCQSLTSAFLSVQTGLAILFSDHQYCAKVLGRYEKML